MVYLNRSWYKYVRYAAARRQLCTCCLFLPAPLRHLKTALSRYPFVWPGSAPTSFVGWPGSSLNTVFDSIALPASRWVSYENDAEERRYRCCAVPSFITELRTVFLSPLLQPTDSRKNLEWRKTPFVSGFSYSTVADPLPAS